MQTSPGQGRTALRFEKPARVKVYTDTAHDGCLGYGNELFSRTLNDRVSIPTPKRSTKACSKRIGNRAHVYAPIGIPHDYELVVTVPNANGVDADFRIDPLPKAAPPSATNVYELEKDAQARVFTELETQSGPLVYLRTALYFTCARRDRVFSRISIHGPKQLTFRIEKMS